MKPETLTWGAHQDVLPNDPELPDRIAATRQEARRGWELGFSDGLAGLERTQAEPTRQNAVSAAQKEGYKAGWATAHRLLGLDGLFSELAELATRDAEALLAAADPRRTLASAHINEKGQTNEQTLD